MKDLLLRDHVVVRTTWSTSLWRTTSVRILCRHLADYVKKLYQNACCTCSTIIFSHSTNQIIFLNPLMTTSTAKQPLTPMIMTRKTTKWKKKKSGGSLWGDRMYPLVSKKRDWIELLLLGNWSQGKLAAAILLGPPWNPIVHVSIGKKIIWMLPAKDMLFREIVRKVHFS